jgi:hypothetical protein
MEYLQNTTGRSERPEGLCYRRRLLSAVLISPAAQRYDNFLNRQNIFLQLSQNNDKKGQFKIKKFRNAEI